MFTLQGHLLPLWQMPLEGSFRPPSPAFKSFPRFLGLGVSAAYQKLTEGEEAEEGDASFGSQGSLQQALQAFRGVSGHELVECRSRDESGFPALLRSFRSDNVALLPQLFETCAPTVVVERERECVSSYHHLQRKATANGFLFVAGGLYGCPLTKHINANLRDSFTLRALLFDFQPLH